MPELLPPPVQYILDLDSSPDSSAIDAYFSLNRIVCMRRWHGKTKPHPRLTIELVGQPSQAFPGILPILDYLTEIELQAQNLNPVNEPIILADRMVLTEKNGLSPESNLAQVEAS